MVVPGEEVERHVDERALPFWSGVGFDRVPVEPGARAAAVTHALVGAAHKIGAVRPAEADGDYENGPERPKNMILKMLQNCQIPKLKTSANQET